MGYMLASYHDLAFADQWLATFRHMAAGQIADASPHSQHLVLHLNFDVELIGTAPLELRSALIEKAMAQSLRTFKNKYSDILPPSEENRLHVYLNDKGLRELKQPIIVIIDGLDCPFFALYSACAGRSPVPEGFKDIARNVYLKLVAVLLRLYGMTTSAVKKVLFLETVPAILDIILDQQITTSQLELRSLLQNTPQEDVSFSDIGGISERDLLAYTARAAEVKVRLPSGDDNIAYLRQSIRDSHLPPSQSSHANADIAIQPLRFHTALVMHWLDSMRGLVTSHDFALRIVSAPFFNKHRFLQDSILTMIMQSLAPCVGQRGWHYLCMLRLGRPVHLRDDDAPTYTDPSAGLTVGTMMFLLHAAGIVKQDYEQVNGGAAGSTQQLTIRVLGSMKHLNDSMNNARAQLLASRGFYTLLDSLTPPPRFFEGLKPASEDELRNTTTAILKFQTLSQVVPEMRIFKGDDFDLGKTNPYRMDIVECLAHSQKIIIYELKWVKLEDICSATTTLHVGNVQDAFHALENARLDGEPQTHEHVHTPDTLRCPQYDRSRATSTQSLRELHTAASQQVAEYFKYLDNAPATDAGNLIDRLDGGKERVKKVPVGEGQKYIVETWVIIFLGGVRTWVTRERQHKVDWCLVPREVPA
ncbi:hypothetical protein K523DRAFT_414014 [Schizophyllum commune Tattone D]|nr:hypothetical protein K523DRAFT_414014 [Schizophyllum commune Tattone D]